MKKTLGIIGAILVLVTIFGLGVFKFRVGVNDTSIVDIDATDLLNIPTDSSPISN